MNNLRIDPRLPSGVTGDELSPHDEQLLRRLTDLFREHSTAINTVNAAAAAAAPLSASYVTLGTNATLTNERVLTAGTGITLTDAGAGSTLTVAASAGPSIVMAIIFGG